VNILQIITPSKIAGAERSTVSLAQHLERRGHKVVVACKRGHPLVEMMRRTGVDARDLPIGGKLNVRAPLLLAHLIRQEQIDVVHTQLSTAALWGSLAARWTGRPVLAHVRALNTKWCYLLADRIVANSHGVKTHLVAQGVPAARIDVIYNGIDPECYQSALTPAEARRQCGLAPTGAIVGVAAHLTAKKGHAGFLEAAAALRGAAPGATFLLLGDGPERARLQALAASLGMADRVVFAGFRDDVCPWMRAMDVVVLPSIAMEGFGRVLVEAALMGKPAVTTDLGGTAEVVQDGVTGYVVPPGDVPALTRAILRLLENAPARVSMGEAARRRALRLFTVDRMVQETEAAYHSLLHRPITPDVPLTSDAAQRHAAL
jgi:glycosyltransferase involved in cell wall biosynthesis